MPGVLYCIIAPGIRRYGTAQYGELFGVMPVRFGGYRSQYN